MCPWNACIDWHLVLQITPVILSLLSWLVPAAHCFHSTWWGTRWSPWRRTADMRWFALYVRNTYEAEITLTGTKIDSPTTCAWWGGRRCPWRYATARWGEGLGRWYKWRGWLWRLTVRWGAVLWFIIIRIIFLDYIIITFAVVESTLWTAI